MKRWIAIAALLTALPALANETPKGLSPQQVEGLRAGRGMSLSLPAELNGKPGPLHVLELADALGLRPEQKDAMTALVARMKAEAIPIGEGIIAEEARLDALFREPAPDQAAIEATVHEIGRLNAELRLAHLRTHLAAAQVLSPGQSERYTELRRHHHSLSRPAGEGGARAGRVGG